MTVPNSKNQAHPSRTRGVCGIDEVGRGPLAGPLVAAAVVLPPEFDVTALADSKALNPRRREIQRERLLAAGAGVGFGWVEPNEIDRWNIHRATLIAMERAWQDLLASHPDLARYTLEIRVDGLYYPPDLPHPVQAIVGGDRLVPEIMAASIMAKTTRDAWMTEYSVRDPRYGFERHKGYPTADHKAAIRRHGPCPIHRRSFRGVSV